MKRYTLSIFGTMVIAFTVLSFVHAENEKLVIVASESTYKAAQEWTEFLYNNDVPFKHVAADEFEKFKNSKYIVVMGSPNETGGIGGIVQEALSPQEAEWVSQQGNRKMYIKTKVWAEGQSIIVFAGWDQKAVESVRKETQKSWWTQISSWFDIEVDSKTLLGY
jgi:hypothetical protein